MAWQTTLASLSSISLFAMSPALAEECAKREQVITRLQSQYSENLTGGGLQSASDGQVLVEIWSSDATGTFTVMLTNTDGVSCVVATGTDWQGITSTPTGSAG